MICVNPFGCCPIYETENFKFTKVKEKDAEQLYRCYSDPVTKSRMNNDNCGGPWNIKGVESVQKGIRGWIKEFDDGFYIRWSINHKNSGKIVGTVEIAPIPNFTRFWDGKCNTGILRIDIISSLEDEKNISEVLSVVSDHFFADFNVGKIIIKATEEDSERRTALRKNNFNKFEDSSFPFSDYFVKSR